MLGWRRVRLTLIASTLFGLLLSIPSSTAAIIVVARAMLVGLAALLAFGFFERWPRRLPQWLARWVLQLVGIVAVIPLGALFAYWVTTGGDPQFGQNQLRLNGYLHLTFTGVLFAPWIAFAAMVRQRDAFARNQALAFELERSELERKALDARLRLLQAQVEPHFLFNTLANVQALVDAGSPQASKVLESLIAYLRAAVPRLHEPATTLGQELQLVRAYLEVMQMRMPDRLQFTLSSDASATGLQLPADDAADARRERRPPRHRPQRGRRVHRRRGAAAGWPLQRACHRYGRRSAGGRQRARYRADHAARAPATRVRRRRTVEPDRDRAARHLRGTQLSGAAGSA